MSVCHTNVSIVSHCIKSGQFMLRQSSTRERFYLCMSLKLFEMCFSLFFYSDPRIVGFREKKTRSCLRHETRTKACEFELFNTGLSYEYPNRQKKLI